MEHPAVVIPVFVLLNISLASAYYYMDKEIVTSITCLFLAMFLLGAML